VKAAIHKTTYHFSQQPRALFRLDALGGLLSAGLMFFVLRPFHAAFGIPPGWPLPLAGLGLAYALYSGVCSLWAGSGPLPDFPAAGRTRLKIIALANGLYCLFTLWLIGRHYPQLSLLGLAYFLGEVLLIASLAALEWQVAQTPGHDSPPTNLFVEFAKRLYEQLHDQQGLPTRSAFFSAKSNRPWNLFAMAQQGSISVC
jgi:hypothetical protein